MAESLPFIFGSGGNATWDWGFLYVTIIFALIPIACVIHFIWNLIMFAIRIKKGNKQLTEVSSLIISVGYLSLLYFYYYQ